MEMLGVRARGGFSLVEVMIVILIISLLAMLAVPAVQRSQRKGRAAAVVNDFRVFAAEFEHYAQETGGWPAESAAGAIPTGMAGRLNATAWQRLTPVGGKYNWERDRRHRGVRYAAAISINAVAGAPLPIDLPQFREIDQAIDDGNLNTGNFRRGASNVPLFIIQP